MTFVSPNAVLLAVALTGSWICPAFSYEEVAGGTGNGTVSGQVTFKGTVPTRQVIPNKDLGVIRR